MTETVNPGRTGIHPYFFEANERAMRILVNEREVETPAGELLGGLAARMKPGADLLIVNGFPAKPDTGLKEGDSVVLIRKGEHPAEEELEALLCARHTPGVHKKVKAAHVGIAGVGGLGSHVAVALARLGIGELTIVDFDVVEPSNLNRQYYFVDQLGREKALALKETLARINPFVKVNAHVDRLDRENIARYFCNCPIVVEAFDAADQKAMLVETVLFGMKEKFMVAASGLAGFGPSDEVKVNRLGPRLFVVGDLESEARPGMGLMAPRVGVAANAQANVALRLILGEEN